MLGGVCDDWGYRVAGVTEIAVRCGRDDEDGCGYKAGAADDDWTGEWCDGGRGPPFIHGRLLVEAVLDFVGSGSVPFGKSTSMRTRTISLPA